MNDRVGIVGIGWAGFRPKTSTQSYRELIYEAAIKAYTDAGVDPRSDVDSFVTVAEDFHEGTSIFDEYTPDQLGAALKSMHTITGDGLHGLATGYMLVRTGQFDIVVVEGHSKASNILTLPEVAAYAQDPIFNRPLHLNNHFIAGLEMHRFLFETETTLEQCAQVVVKNKRNALRNPQASYSADLTLSEIMGGPPVAWPLSQHHVSDHADGSIVMVLASEKTAVNLTDKPIWILGAGWCNDSFSLEYRDWANAIYAERSARQAYRQAGIRDPRQVIDFAEVDDLYAYKELQTLEALGLCRPGEAGILTEEGATELDGDLPINVSGGSLGIGDLLDANGLARAMEIIIQLRGEAGSRQLENINIGLAQSWRGTPTTSGAVVILSN
jgi:acetyl-CoA C-acetyltransferase